MIIWLASYPRSGNTLVRLTLQHMGLGPTYSVHGDAALRELSIDEVIGHSDLPAGGIDELVEDDRWLFVKTHNLPGDDEFPAIYVVRDGRDAIVSYAHYLQDVAKNDAPLTTLIAGLIKGDVGGFGGWSDHVRKWRRAKPGLITIRYEDLLADPIAIVAGAIKAAGHPASIDDEPLAVPSFEELRQLSGEFFRSGKVGGWVGEIAPPLERHFWRLHGLGMAIAGYGLPEDKLPIAADALPEVSAHTYVGDLEAHDPIIDEICMPPYYGPKDRHDFDFLLNLARKNNVRDVFEYGTGAGNTVANLCKYTNSRITTLNALAEQTSGAIRTYDLEKSKIGRVYRNYGYADRVTQIYCDSINFIPEVEIEGKFDLIIIDACHDFEYVLNDFLTINHFVRDDGYLLFHDCDESMKGHLSGCWRACTHLRKAGYNIKKISGTWWAIWSPRDQQTEIDRRYVSLLDYHVQKTRDEVRKKSINEQQVLSLQQRLRAVQRHFLLLRRLPEARLLLWLHRKFFG